MAAQDARASQSSHGLDPLERFQVPRRRHHHLHLWQGRHDLDAADRGPACLQRRGRRARQPTLAVARLTHLAAKRDTRRPRSADAPALHQDASAGGCARLLAAGEIHLSCARRPRCRVELLQSPQHCQRPVVRRLEQHARPRGPAHRTADIRYPPIFPRLARQGRLSLLVLLGEHPELVGHPPSAERQALAFLGPEERPGRGDPRHRALSRHRDRRSALSRHPRALQLRLHEKECAAIGAGRRHHVRGRRRAFLSKGHERPLARCAHAARRAAATSAWPWRSSAPTARIGSRRGSCQASIEGE